MKCNAAVGLFTKPSKLVPDWWPKEGGSLIGKTMEMEGVKRGETEVGDV